VFIVPAKAHNILPVESSVALLLEHSAKGLPETSVLDATFS